MENTSNYGLKRWDGEDRILHTEFNDNWDKIDTALKSSADGVAALQTALAGAGNCSVETYTYTGTGTYGANDPTAIAFPKTPAAVLIFGYNFLALLTDKASDIISLSWFANGSDVFFQSLRAAWQGGTLTFYDTDNANDQGNGNGRLYQVIALYNS